VTEREPRTPAGRGPGRRALIEVAAATLAVSALIRALAAAGGFWTVLVPAIWIVAPVWAVASRRLSARDAGLTAGAWTRGCRWLLLAVACILVPFAAAAAALRSAGALPAWVGGGPLGVEDAILQLVLVVFPEEVFFRGYIQGRLGAGREPGRAGLLVRVVYTAALFALAHVVVEAGWIRAAVFFPGIVMGWLRERTGGLLAPAGFHWLANLAWAWV
jgi:membrane protease YdiL (CAAX protease family)